MSPCDSFGADNSTVDHESKSDLVPPNWQEAFHRVFLYLQMLQVPEEKALELAHEALRIAGSNQRDTAAGNSSIPKAMCALRELLRKKLFSQGDIFFHENLNGISSMPPLNRDFMAPVAIDLIPWRTSFVRFLKRAVVIVSRPLNFVILFIFLIILFALLAFWK